MAQHIPSPLDRALLALEGLSIGDAFGERFLSYPDLLARLIIDRALPSAPWKYTNDTEMSLSVVNILRHHQGIDQDALARSFVEHHDSVRNYGRATEHLLLEMSKGQSWRDLAPQLFKGVGSYGNGAAMRVAPIGAYFADDFQEVVEQTKRATLVTHTHPEGLAGAIAVAIAAAWAYRVGIGSAPSFANLIDMVLPYVPESEVARRLARANQLSPATPASQAAAVLGNGSDISCQDTVPFALWCASSYLNDFEGAMWHTALGFGDLDTNCAIVGGIVALRVGQAGIPETWRASREPLPSWALGTETAP